MNVEWNRYIGRVVHGLACLVTLMMTPVVASGQQVERRPVVAILPFTNGAMTPERANYDALSLSLPERLITLLGRNPRIQVVERTRMRELLAEQDAGAGGRIDASTAARIGRLIGARHVITGAFWVDTRRRLQIDARAVNVETSLIEHVEEARGKEDELFEVLDELSARLNRGLRLPEPPPASVRPSPRAPADPRGRPRNTTGSSDIQQTLIYGQAMEAEDRNEPAKAARLYRRYIAMAEGDDAMRPKAMERLAGLESPQR